MQFQNEVRFWRDDVNDDDDIYIYMILRVGRTFGIRLRPEIGEGDVIRIVVCVSSRRHQKSLAFCKQSGVPFLLSNTPPYTHLGFYKFRVLE